jgi:fructokinase
VIVLGGGMSNIDFIYENINDALKKYVFTDTLHTKVVKNIHGDSSGVRGAAWLS